MIYDEIKDQLLDKKEQFEDIIGQKKTKTSLLSALLSGRHIVILGPPGIGKTTLAKNVAKLLPDTEVEDPVTKEKRKLTKDQRFVRLQGSPDLTVEDILGDIDPIKALKFGPTSVEAFSPGKLFKAHGCVLFFDELNRCPEKLQNSLLQVLEEGTATIGGYDVTFPVDFLLIGTMNPEDTSTEKLSDVLLDRFDVVYMDYPDSLEDEKTIVKTKGKSIAQVTDAILGLMVYFVRLLRQSDKVEKKPSVRATLGLYERAQAHALLHGRDQVSFADVQAVVMSVLGHRIRLKPSSRYLVTPTEFVQEMFEQNIDENTFEEEIKKEQGDSL